MTKTAVLLSCTWAALSLWRPLSVLAQPTAKEPPPSQPAQPTAAQIQEAGERFQAGVALYTESNFQAALIEFRRAYEIAPTYKILYNLGQAAFELKDYVAAQSAFERYLADGGTKIDAQRRKKVGSYLSELQKRVAHVTVKVSVEGAEVALDDVVVGTAPLPQPLVVNVGRRKISATKDGFQLATRTLDVAGGDTSEVEIVLVAKEAPAIAPPADPAVVPAGPAKPVAVEPAAGVAPGPWIAFGVTAAAVAGAAITGGLAVAAKSDYDDEVAKLPGDPQVIAEAGEKTKSLAIATDVLIGTAGAGAIVTLILFVTSSKGDKAAMAAPPVRFGVGPAGASLAGTF